MCESMTLPPPELVAELRRCWPAGTRVEYEGSSDPDTYTLLRYGDRGRVQHVDDLGTVHVLWDRGGYLGMIWMVDRFRRIRETASA